MRLKFIANAAMKEKIVQAYIAYYLKEGQFPASMYHLAKAMKTTEASLYAHAGTVEALQSMVWTQALEKTMAQVQADAHYEGFNVREKYLSFLYCFFQDLLENRSFYAAQITAWKTPRPELLEVMKPSRAVFLEYVNQLVQLGIESGEIKSVKYLDKHYADGLWLQFLSICAFWAKDSSANLEQTDAFIEKSIKVSFELMGMSALDAVLDWGKFVWQSKR